MKKFIISAAFLITVFIALNIFIFSVPQESEDKLTVVFIDTGDSDSIFIRMPDGKTALIDGGESNDLEKIHSVLYKYRVKTIDYLINSHQHDDHIGTFPKLMKIYEIKNLYMPKSEIENEHYNMMLREAENKGIPVNFIKAGDIICDETVEIDVLAPYTDIIRKDENNYSAVYLLKYRENTFLFTGDAGRKITQTLVSDYGLSHCDVIKAPHHGSDEYNVRYFYENTTPQYVVITTSNTYERPSDRLKYIFDDLNIKYLITNESGNITMISDGINIKVTEEKSNANR